MKTLCVVFAVLFAGMAFAADTPPKSMDAAAGHKNHRYIVERTFPPNVLASLDATTKARINRTNAMFGVKWEMSYANADETKTYCVYEGPSEAAVREAAQANNIPADTIVEVPVTINPVDADNK